MPRRIRTDLLAQLAAAQAEGDVLAIHMPSLLAWLAMDGAEDFRAFGDPAAVEFAERAAVHPATERAAARRAGAVEVIPVHGMITNRPGFLEMFGFATSTMTLSRRIAAAARDEEVKAIVLDIDSPGGTVPGVDALADEIFALRGVKPIVAQVNGMAASAAYWIAASADEIVAPEASYTGSIGVFGMHVDLTAALEEAGVKVTMVASSADKVEEQPFTALSAEALAHMQSRVDGFDRMFTGAVARGRGMQPSAVRDMKGRGRVHSGRAALEMGLIDKVRTMAGTLAAYGVDMHAPTERRGGATARRRRELGLIDI